MRRRVLARVAARDGPVDGGRGAGAEPVGRGAGARVATRDPAPRRETAREEQGPPAARPGAVEASGPGVTVARLAEERRAEQRRRDRERPRWRQGRQPRALAPPAPRQVGAYGRLGARRPARRTVRHPVVADEEGRERHGVVGDARVARPRHLVGRRRRSGPAEPRPLSGGRLAGAGRIHLGGTKVSADGRQAGRPLARLRPRGRGRAGRDPRRRSRERIKLRSEVGGHEG